MGTVAMGTQPACTAANARQALTAGTRMKGMSRRGFSINGMPNSSSSFTFSKAMGRLATASRRSPGLRTRHSTATTSDKVPPAPPMKANAPSSPAFSGCWGTWSVSSSMAFQPTACSSTWNNGCSAW